MSKLELYAIAFLVMVLSIVGAGALGFYKGDHYRAAADVGLQAVQTAQLQQQHDATMQTVAQAIAGIQVHNQTVQAKTVESVKEVPIYSQCLITADVAAEILDSRKPQ